MLKNITDKKVEIKFDGMVVTIPPSHMVAVDQIWGITNPREVSILEDRFLNKYKVELVRHKFEPVDNEIVAETMSMSEIPKKGIRKTKRQT